MKRFTFIIVVLTISLMSLNAQTYVNDMLQAQVQADCIIEGGVIYTDAGSVFYSDGSYVQKAVTDLPTSFIFNRDLFSNKFLTGFKLNMFLRGADNWQDYVKVEYSLDELNYIAVPNMKVDYSKAPTEAYWTDVYFQGALPANVKEIKVTLIANASSVQWLPCYRRTEIFYAGGTAYTYVLPPYVVQTVEGFNVDFETPANYKVDMSGSQNLSCSATIETNPSKSGINTSNNALKIVQALPTSPDVWGWGNGDWFGAAIAYMNGTDKQLTIITDATKYLHMQIYRPDNTKFALETWGGTANQKSPYDYVSTGQWQDFVIDLSAQVGKTFSDFYFSPNFLYQTNNIATAETTYLDNILLSSNATPTTTGTISLFDDKVQVMATDKSIIVRNAQAKSLQVFTIDGKILVNKVVAENEESVQMNKGAYIVKLNSKTAKVIVF